MLIAWPAKEFGWVVDAVPNLGRALWTQITPVMGETNQDNNVSWPATVIVTNDENTVTLPTTNAASFYRLRKALN